MEKPIDQKLEEGEAWKELALAYRVNTDNDGGVLFIHGVAEIAAATDKLTALGVVFPPFKVDEP